MIFKRMGVRLLPALVLVGVVSGSSGVYAEGEGDGIWAAAQKSGSIRCGTAEAPPYIMKDPATGEYSGFFVDACREFAEILKVKPVFVDTSWDNMIAGLQSRKWDLAPALTATPQRALSIVFSKNLSATESTFIYNQKNPKTNQPKGVADIDQPGVTIAVSSGTAQDKSLTAIIKNASIMRLPGPDEIRLAVMSKRADVIFDTSAANDLFAASHPDWAVVLRPVPAIDKKGVSFGLRRDTSYADLQVLDLYINDAVATGHMDELIKKAIAHETK